MQIYYYSSFVCNFRDIAIEQYISWAEKYCKDAKYINVGSDTQNQQFLFAPCVNSIDTKRKEIKPENVRSLPAEVNLKECTGFILDHFEQYFGLVFLKTKLFFNIHKYFV